MDQLPVPLPDQRPVDIVFIAVDQHLPRKGVKVIERVEDPEVPLLLRLDRVKLPGEILTDPFLRPGDQGENGIRRDTPIRSSIPIGRRPSNDAGIQFRHDLLQLSGSALPEPLKKILLPPKHGSYIFPCYRRISCSLGSINCSTKSFVIAGIHRHPPHGHTPGHRLSLTAGSPLPARPSR